MKRIVPIVFAFVALLYFCSCGGGSSGSSQASLQTVYITQQVRIAVAENEILRASSDFAKLQSSVAEVFQQYLLNDSSFKLKPVFASDPLLQPSQALIDTFGRVYLYIYPNNGKEIGGKRVYDIISFVKELHNTAGVITSNCDSVSASVVPFVQAWVRIDSIPYIAHLADVGHLALVTRPLKSASTEQLIRSDASMTSVWPEASGKGIKVGVISDDCGNLPSDYNGTSTLLSTQGSSLPGPLSGIDVLDDTWDGERSHEGLAMMEIVNKVAPKASLAFATGYGPIISSVTNSMGMLNLWKAIGTLKTDGCNVITDDLLYIEEPAFEDGPIAQRIDAFSNEVVYTSAAGNWAQNVFSFTFLPLKNQTIGKFQSWKNFTIHDNSSHDYLQYFMIPDGGYVDVMLQWDDPYLAGESTGRSANDYNLYLVDVASGVIVTSSTNVQNGGVTGASCFPFEHLYYAANACYGSQGFKLYISQQAVSDVDPNPIARMKLLIRGIHTKDLPSNDKSIFGHPAAANAICCAGVKTTGNFDAIEDFSSRGNAEIVSTMDPISVVTGHRPLDGDVLRNKPDVASASGVALSLPHYEFFSGTSAAAPHVAGLAAMILSYRISGVGATVQIDKARNTIRNGCIKFEDPVNHTKNWGYGRSDAFKSLALAFNSLPGHIAVTGTFSTGTLGPVQTISVSLPASVSPTDKIYISATIDNFLGSEIQKMQLLPAGIDLASLSGPVMGYNFNEIVGRGGSTAVSASPLSPMLGFRIPDPPATLDGRSFSGALQFQASFNPAPHPGILRDFTVFVRKF